jgi:hypothetical protein
MQNLIFRLFLLLLSTKAVDPNKTLDDVDPELLEMYKKLGISVDEQKMMNNGHGYCGRLCFCSNNIQEKGEKELFS